ARGREYVVIVRPVEGGMAMHQLYFKDEIRTIRDLPMGDTPELAAGELKLARALIEQTTEKRFVPDAFHDEFRARVEAAIQKKIRSGKEISHFESPAEETATTGNVVDLMEILQRSLNKGGGSTKATTRKPPKRVTTQRKARATSRSA